MTPVPLTYYSITAQRILKSGQNPGYAFHAWQSGAPIFSNLSPGPPLRHSPEAERVLAQPKPARSDQQKDVQEAPQLIAPTLL